MTPRRQRLHGQSTYSIVLHYMVLGRHLLGDLLGAQGLGSTVNRTHTEWRPKNQGLLLVNTYRRSVQVLAGNITFYLLVK